jgi:Plasmid pRiA4b ORF-3-like protein
MKTYTFHVSIPGFGRLWRKIELEADQTLEDLHLAIQDAFEFDNDHLYSFFMSGRAWDQSTEYCLPEGVDPYGFDLEELDEEEEGEEAPAPLREISEAEAAEALAVLEDESLTFVEKRERLGPLWDLIVAAFLESLSPPDVRETTLESLELERGREFLYIFDYGDEWRFKVRVHAINPDAPEGDYPRIVQSVGEAPEQYPDLFDENYEDDEDFPANPDD